ncbi:MAG: hypothetical protein PF551_02305 [Candidatus Marinimicrobia bacterium]|jgi:hypothetical protein|nr:hypothetical protein [Candidatus Neomarinimicrobiota bacterium]
MNKELDLVKLINDNRQLLIIIASGFVFFLIIFFIYLMIKD